MDGFEIRGMDELISSVSTVMKKFPDRSGDFLRKQALKARGKVVREMKGAVDVNESNRMSLGKIKNYKVSQVKGFGTNQYVELMAKSPHFHLIENGHELISHSGRHIGWVPGYKVMDAVAKKQQVELPKAFEEFAEGILKEEGFL